MFLIENSLDTADLYASYRRLLFSLAYRMLGSVTDSEDIVQEAFLAINEAPTEHVRNIRSYLCKIVTNRCVDRLHSTSKQREVYVGTWLPEPLVTDFSDSTDPAQSYLQKESISMAYLLLLQQLSWVERVVFLLREVMQFEYDEISDMVGKSSTNCRQIFHRAKRSLGSNPLSPTTEQTDPALEQSTVVEDLVTHDHAKKLAEQFMNALTTGDVGKLMHVLSPDATLFTDGGGKLTAPPLPIHGADRIARFLAKFPTLVPSGFMYNIAMVNGEPGVVMSVNDQTFTVASLHVKDERVTELYTIVNPEKLRHVHS